MEIDILEVHKRVKELREIMEFSIETAAEKLGLAISEYEKLESGNDISISNLTAAASLYGADLIALLTGSEPNLKKYEITRKGKGLPVERRKGFSYLHFASLFKNRKANPLFVTAPDESDIPNEKLHTSSHNGNEWDYVISGTLKIIINGKEEILNAGDGIYYDSSTPHSLAAINGKAEFLAVLIN